MIKTGLAGSSVESEDNIINVFTDEPKEEAIIVAPITQSAPTVSKASKMDEIQKAFDMKEKGILSDEEFNTLKAEILAR